MISLGDNETISMDATFGTNDMKFHNVHIDVVCASYMDHYKLANMQWFGGMANFWKQRF